MTNLTVKGSHSYFAADEDRPTGAIRSLQEIRSHAFAGDAYVWQVAQSGYIIKFRLLEFFHAARYAFDGYGDSAYFLPAMRISDEYGDRYDALYLEQGGIWPHTNKPAAQQSNCFQTFFLVEDAIAYSVYLQNNQEYIESLILHHANMDEWLTYGDYDS